MEGNMAILKKCLHLDSSVKNKVCSALLWHLMFTDCASTVDVALHFLVLLLKYQVIYSQYLWHSQQTNMFPTVQDVVLMSMQRLLPH